MHPEEILIPISLFLVIFGIIYLYLSTRNKERLALIEKGADASIFMRGKKSSNFIILNLALLLTGIGVGIFIASVLHYSLGVDEGVAYPGTIFLMSGIGLLAGFYLTRKLNTEK